MDTPIKRVIPRSPKSQTVKLFARAPALPAAKNNNSFFIDHSDMNESCPVGKRIDPYAYLKLYIDFEAARLSAADTR
jgi:hypothetical protein